MNYKAKNQVSGPLGIPQLKGAEKVPNYMNDYNVQIKMDYPILRIELIMTHKQQRGIFIKKRLLLR